MVEKVTEISSVCENLTAHDAMIIHAFDVLTDAMSQAPHGRRLLKLCRHRKKRIRKKNLHRLAHLAAMLVNYWMGERREDYHEQNVRRVKHL